MKTQKFPAYRIISTSQFIHVLQSGIQNHERFCFILGSGASVDSGIPMGGTLEKYWMDCLMGKSIDKDGTLPFDRKETIQLAHDLKSASPSKLEYDFKEIVAAWDTAESNKENTLPSKYYFDIYKVRFFPNHRNGYHYLENIMDKADPSIGYRILAQLLTDEKARNNLVITTNFDSLVEDSLFLYTRERPLVINHELLADYLGTPNLERPIIAKVHRGLFFDPLNAPEDVDQLKGKWQEVLKQVLNFYTPIVIGYGGGDHSLMNLLSDKSTKMPNGIYWCYMAEHGLPEKRIQKLVEENNGCFVRTLGFDPLMFKIGDTLCPQIIGVNDTANYLKEQSDIRAENYQEKISEIQKQVEHFTDVSSGEVSEYQETVKRFNQREDDARKSRKAANSQTALDYLQQGREFLKHKDFGNAIQLFTNAIELNPDSYSGYNHRGYAYNSLEKYPEAIKDFTQAIELNPEYADAYNNRGVAYKMIRELDKAIYDLQTAKKINKIHPNPHRHLGDVYTLQEKYDKAIEEYSTAIQLNDKYKEAYEGRARAYLKIGKIQEAEQDEETAKNL